MAGSTALQIRGLSKSFGGVEALRDVDIDICAAQIHAICGENGAGKSTLIKCLSGVVVPDAGTVFWQSRPLLFGDVRACQQAGIAVIHQESSVFPDLNTIDNLFLGRELTRLRGRLLDHRRMRHETIAVLDRLGQAWDIDQPVRELGFAQRQMVSLARALLERCALLIMDEPTASLSARETSVLLDIVRRLRSEGVTILYVSHRLEEIFAMADAVTVLRDGSHIATERTERLSADQLVRLMVGRDFTTYSERTRQTEGLGPPRLQVRHLNREPILHDIDLHVAAGEIVGLAGLVGAGRSELARSIFGIDNYSSGDVLVDGKALPRGNVVASIRHGLALVPEDRQHEGLVTPLDVGTNLSMAVLPRLCNALGIVRHLSEHDLIQTMMASVDVRAASPFVAAKTLSGGNQQKIVLGKWLATRPKVLILDEPTRGIDVGAKAQVHQLIRQLSQQGLATLLISSDLPELLALSDRIVVMRRGHISGQLPGRQATPEKILQLALPQQREIEDTA